MPLQLVRNDITKMLTDAVVNAANSALAHGGGVCGAIFRAAGEKKLEAACREIGHCDVGDAVLTEGYGLPARYIIHAVGPVWQGGTQNEAALLRSCYQRALMLAVRNSCTSIAFPLISSGIYGYPKPEALRVALAAITDFLKTFELQVYLIVLDPGIISLDEPFAAGIQTALDNRACESGRMDCVTEGRPAPPDGTFAATLLRLIEEKGLTGTQAYKRANVSRSLFDRLRREADFRPDKLTALAFAVALRLSPEEACDLLGRAGWMLSRGNRLDRGVESFLQFGNGDIYTLNQILFVQELPQLIGA